MTARAGPRRALLAVAGGGLLFAAHPPADVGWLGVVALAPLLRLARDLATESRRPLLAGAGWGLLAGVAFFGPLLWWIVRFGVVAWVLLVLVQSAAIGAFVAGLAVWGARRGRPLVAVVWWVALEAARSSWPLGGFPWGVLGYSQHNGGPLLPVARSLGVLGVSAVCAALAVCLEAALSRGATALRGAAAGDAGQAAARAVRGPVLAGAALIGFSVVAAGAPPARSARTVDVAAVQGNNLELPPVTTRTSAARVERIVDRMVTTTARLADDPPQLTVWPENALDADPREDPELRRRLDEALRLLDGQALLVGTLLDGPRPRTFLNAIVRFGPGARVEDLYVKRKLVPFGEYVPARRWLGWLPPLRQIPSDGVPGNSPEVFDLAGALVGPVTCYESVYPRLVHSQVRAGAQLLVVSTNNASFGRTPASRQHLAFSQLRAVETGRWVLHAGISGISAVIDPHGRVSQRTGLFEQAIVREQLPLVSGLTVATRTGDVVGTGALALATAALLWRSATRLGLARSARRRVGSERVPAAAGRAPVI